jgi:hypothetical protein
MSRSDQMPRNLVTSRIPLSKIIQRHFTNLGNIPNEILVERLYGKKPGMMSANQRIFNRTLITYLSDPSDKSANRHLKRIMDYAALALVSKDSVEVAFKRLREEGLSSLDQNVIGSIAEAFTDLSIARVEKSLAHKAAEHAYSVMTVLNSEEKEMLIARLSRIERWLGTTEGMEQAKKEALKESDSVVRCVDELKEIGRRRASQEIAGKRINEQGLESMDEEINKSGVSYTFEEGMIEIRIKDASGWEIPNMQVDLRNGYKIRYTARCLSKDKDGNELPEVRHFIVTNNEDKEHIYLFSDGGTCIYQFDTLMVGLSDEGGVGIRVRIYGEPQEINQIKENLQDEVTFCSIITKPIVQAQRANEQSMEELRGQIFRSIEAHSIEQVIDLVENEGVDPNLQNENGFSPLMRAAAQGGYDICKYLVLKRNVDVNAKNNNGFNALMFASTRYEHDTVESLIEKFNIVKLLLDNGIELNPDDPRGARVAIELARKSRLNETAALIEERMEIVPTEEPETAAPKVEEPSRKKRTTDSILLAWFTDPGEEIVEKGEAGPEELYVSNVPHQDNRETSKVFRVTQPMPIIAKGNGPKVSLDTHLISPYLGEGERVQMLFTDKSEVPDRIAQLFPENEWRWVLKEEQDLPLDISPIGRIQLAGQWIYVYDQKVHGAKRLKSMELHCSISEDGEVVDVWGSADIGSTDSDKSIMEAFTGIKLRSEGKD